MSAHTEWSLPHGISYAGSQISEGIGNFTSEDFEQDVNTSLQTFDTPSSSLPGYDDPFAISIRDLQFAQTSPVPQPLFDIPMVKRTESGLDARAKPFVPASQQQQQQQQQQIQQQLHQPFQCGRMPNTFSRTNSQLQQLTPLRTNFNNVCPSPAYSAPVYCTEMISPQVIVTGEMDRAQWPSMFAPASAVDNWVGTNCYSGAQLGSMSAWDDPDLLTPLTAESHSSSFEHSPTRSVASASSYYCEHQRCQKSFKSKTEFLHHKRNHGPRTNVCSQCSKAFVFKKDLRRHNMIHSTESKTFFCAEPDCQYATKGFFRKDHLERHKRTHTGMLTPAATSTSMSRTASVR